MRTILYLVAVGALLVALGIVVLPRDEPAGVVEAAALPVELTEFVQPTTREPAPPTPAAEQSAPQPNRLEPDIRSAITGYRFPDVESPPWADEMEGAILAHVAERPGLKLTDLQVQCAVEACVVFLGGISALVYELDFDVFAREHGFAFAAINSIDGGPHRIVTLRR